MQSAAVHSGENLPLLSTTAPAMEKKKIMKHKETIFLLFHAHNMFISNFASTVAQMLTGKMCRVKLVRTAWLNPRALLSLVGLLSHFVFLHLLFMRTPL